MLSFILTGGYARGLPVSLDGQLDACGLPQTMLVRALSAAIERLAEITEAGLDAFRTRDGHEPASGLRYLCTSQLVA
jgi:hypothetical protein